jgi:hypothetical protein
MSKLCALLFNTINKFLMCIPKDILKDTGARADTEE